VGDSVVVKYKFCWNCLGGNC